jgi:hypothetical protein
MSAPDRSGIKRCLVITPLWGLPKLGHLHSELRSEKGLPSLRGSKPENFSPLQANPTTRKAIDLTYLRKGIALPWKPPHLKSPVGAKDPYVKNLS